MSVQEMFIPITFFLLVFGMFYLYIAARNKERMALIEKGADASIFYSKKSNGKHALLKWGLFCLGIALGILLGSVLALTAINEVVSYFSMIILFGGLGLISSYLIVRKLKD